MKLKYIFLLAVSVFVIFFLPFFFGQSLFCCDNILIIFPARAFLNKALTSMIYPLWNPTVFSGMPFLADINLSPLYPAAVVESLLLSFASWFFIVNSSVIIHTVIAFLGMYLCAGLLTNSRIAKLTAAVVYVFSGIYITYTNNLPMLYAASYTPWVLWGVSRAIRTGVKKHILIAVILGALQIISGHPQITYLTWLFMVLFLPVVKIQSWKRTLVYFGGIGVFSVLLTSVQLLPFFELAFSSTRTGGGIAYASQGAFPLSALFRFFLPVLTGSAGIGTDWWQGGSLFGYMGTLILFVLFVSFRKDKIFYILSSIGVVFFIASFGTSLPVYRLLYTLVPGVSLFRVPSHFILISLVCVCLLAARSSELFGIVQQRRMARIGFILCCGLFTFLVLSILYIANQDIIFSYITIQKIQFIGKSGIQTIVKEILIFGLICTLSCFLISRSSRRFLHYVLWFCITLEVMVYSRNALLTFPARHLAQFIDHSQTTLVPHERYYFSSDAYPSGIEKKFDIPALPQEMFYQFRSNRPNLGVIQRKGYVNGYGSLIPRSYQSLFVSKAKDPTGVEITQEDDTMLNELAVTKMITAGGKLVERNLALPYYRAVLSDGSMISVFPDVEIPGYIKIQIPQHSTAITAAVPYMKGWTAFVDGKRRSIQGKLLTTVIKKDEKVLILRYQPQSVIVGVVVSIVMAVILIVWGLLPNKEKSDRNTIQHTKN